MTLDLLQVAPQVQAMAQEDCVRRRTLAWRRDVAVSLMEAWDARLDELRLLVQQEQPWLVAEPLEPLRAAVPAPAVPPDVTVVATDGSSIDLDRHGLAQCYLINVGGAVIRYGSHPDAALTSCATLYYRDEDLYLDGDGARVPVQGTLVDLKRTLAEQQRGLELAGAAHGRAPVVAVADGTLLLWQLSGRAAEEAYVAEAIAGYAAGLEAFRRLGVPICSYVSRPGGHEVVNLLRLAACPGGPGEGSAPGCERCVQRQCLRDLLEPLPDRALMGHLRRGERSARFASRSPVLRHYGAGIQFVYLNVGDEVGRVEVPAWVGDDRALLDLVHATIIDGCRRGWGYPPALSEAHEQAVMRGGEREAFLRMAMEALNVEGQPAVVSAKGLSKNRRAV
jgi:NurA domain